MEHFSYLENLKHDIYTYMDENDEYFYGMYADRDITMHDWCDKMSDELWAEDSVTGNGSGSYTFSREEAKQNVLADFDTVWEAVRHFCIDDAEVGKRFMEQDWEWFDVTARCFMLWEALWETAEWLNESNKKLNDGEPYFLKEE